MHRYSIHKIKPEGRKYYHDLRLKKTLKDTKPFTFDRLFEKRARRYNVKFKEVGKRLLAEPYASQIFNGENLDLILRRVITEIVEERKRQRVIDLD